MDELQAVDRAIAEMAVDALDDLRRDVLDLERGTARHVDVQDAALALAAPEGELHRRQLAASSGPTITAQSEISAAEEKPCLPQRAAGQRRQQGADRAAARRCAFAPLVRRPSSNHSIARARISWPDYTICHDANPPHFDRRSALVGPAARLVRPPPPPPAVAGRAGRDAGPLPGLAQRDHAAADHGRHRRALFSTLRRALADGRARWPRRALDDVLHAWQGLGYYARARNLHRCAAGRGRRCTAAAFPIPRRRCATCPASAATPPRRSRRSPSTGRAVVVDGNVERVVARLFARGRRRCRTPSRCSTGSPDSLTPDARSGDYAQAMMDLGATICVPRKPTACCARGRRCLRAARHRRRLCRAKRPKPEKPTRRGVAFWLVRDDGAVLLRRRAGTRPARRHDGGAVDRLGRGPAARGRRRPCATRRSKSPIPRCCPGRCGTASPISTSSSRSRRRAPMRAAPPDCVWCPPDALRRLRPADGDEEDRPPRAGARLIGRLAPF